jgi:hypothetical protein
MPAARSAKRPTPQKRGRPPKYGGPATVVAVTLPVEVVASLRRAHRDIGWAIVSLVARNRRPESAPAPVPEAQLVEVGAQQSLIVVDPRVFKSLSGVQMVPLSETSAFLALDEGQGMADLELAVGDRRAQVPARTAEHAALTRLLEQLKKWRQTAALKFERRSIILVNRARRG